ncbi:MAG: efflux transporter periplasmic adaptor subunit [Gammaproteobacteria bacterium]|nr:MAG: efflux transporter periplasmic adaptor subunit [Gammaproteobacteria bacterium]
MALNQSKPDARMMQKPEKVWRVNTVAVQYQDLSPEITIYGRVETPRKASMNAALVADVIEVKILEGSEVEVGQVLLKLDDTDVHLLINQRQADLAEINAAIDSELLRFKRDKELLEHENKLLEIADNAVGRAKKLEHSRLASQSFLDEAYAAKQRQLLTLKRLKHDIAQHPARLAGLKARQIRAQALLEQSQVDLQRTVITAPFTGRVAKLDVSIGNRVRTGDRLLSIYDLENLEVRAQIPGRYLKQIRTSLEQNKQQTATAYIDDNLLQFSLARLSGEIRPDSGGIDGLFRCTSDRNALVLGAFVDLTLKLSQQSSVIAIPFNALYGLNKVYRLTDGHLQSVNVERVGEYHTEQGISLLVRSEELKEADLIISTQLPNAITGLRVEALDD